MEENWVYEMMASMNSKQFEGNPTDPTLESSVTEVSEPQKDTEKAFRDNKKAEIQKNGPTEAVDDTDGCISDAVEYAKPKITGEAQPKKEEGCVCIWSISEIHLRNSQTPLERYVDTL